MYAAATYAHEAETPPRYCGVSLERRETWRTEEVGEATMLIGISRAQAMTARRVKILRSMRVNRRKTAASVPAYETTSASVMLTTIRSQRKKPVGRGGGVRPSRERVTRGS